MKNCKIKRVLVPYADMHEFTVVELMKLYGGNPDFRKFITLADISNGLKYENSNPEIKYVSSRVKFVKYTPDQFLNHVLK